MRMAAHEDDVADGELKAGFGLLADTADGFGEGLCVVGGYCFSVNIDDTVFGFEYFGK